MSEYVIKYMGLTTMGNAEYVLYKNDTRIDRLLLNTATGNVRLNMWKRNLEVFNITDAEYSDYIKLIKQYGDENAKKTVENPADVNTYVIKYVYTTRENNYEFNLFENGKSVDYFLIPQEGESVYVDLNVHYREVLNVNPSNYNDYKRLIEELGDKSCERVGFKVNAKDEYMVVLNGVFGFNSEYRYDVYKNGECIDYFRLNYSRNFVEANLIIGLREELDIKYGNFNDYLTFLSKYRVDNKPVEKPMEYMYTIRFNKRVSEIFAYDLLCNGDKVDFFEIDHRLKTVPYRLTDKYADKFECDTYLDYVELTIDLNQEGEIE